MSEDVPEPVDDEHYEGRSGLDGARGVAVEKCVRAGLRACVRVFSFLTDPVTRSDKMTWNSYFIQKMYCRRGLTHTLQQRIARTERVLIPSQLPSALNKNHHVLREVSAERVLSKMSRWKEEQFKLELWRFLSVVCTCCVFHGLPTGPQDSDKVRHFWPTLFNDCATAITSQLFGRRDYVYRS